MKSYSETLNFLYHFTPAYYKVGASAFKADLEKTYELDRYFQAPHKYYPCIHVGGTNGKGSVSHALAAILIVSGYRTGLYTSPHLVDFAERIKVNGKNIPHEFVVQFVQKHQNIIYKVKPSFFEFTTFMAFEYFKEEKIDVAIIEVGMGGRLDTTNVIEPLLSIITNISYDHQMFLGDTLEKIAFEKAGIIKKNIPIIIGEHHPETDTVFLEKAKAISAPICFAEDFFDSELVNQDFFTQTIKDLKTQKFYITDLIGNYQQKNLKTILVAAEKLKEIFPKINENSIQKALKHVKKLSGLRGRMEFLEWKNQKIIIDVGHNIAGISHLIQQLSIISPKNLHFIIGFVNDKDIEKMLPLFPPSASYYYVKPSVERGLDSDILMEKAKNYGLIGKSFKNIEEIFNELENKIQNHEYIVMSGSCFLVGDFLRFINEVR